MRKSWAEYKREARERERKKRRQEADAAMPDFQQPFFTYFENYRSFDLNWYAGVLGDEWYSFEDDSGIKPDEGALVQEDLDKVQNSLAKAEFLIDLFLDLTADLARSVSEYKRREIEARIAEFEKTEIADPASKKDALTEIARLRKMNTQLSKQVRWAFQQWKVTGE